MNGSLKRLIKRDDIETGAIGSGALGSITAADITYGTIGAAKISGARLTYGTIPTASARVGSVKATKINYGTLTVKQNILVQDGTFVPALGSIYRAFPLAFSVAPRAVNVVPAGGAGGTVNVRVVSISPGSFAARCIQGSKTCYFMAKGSR